MMGGSTIQKHVEQFPDVNKMCNVASCWIYIGILLGVHLILHISRIRVKLIYVLIIIYGVIINKEYYYMVCHVDKYIITFKLVISHWTNKKVFRHIHEY
jgi:hypothetical protein